MDEGGLIQAALTELRGGFLANIASIEGLSNRINKLSVLQEETRGDIKVLRAELAALDTTLKHSREKEHHHVGYFFAGVSTFMAFVAAAIAYYK